MTTWSPAYDGDRPSFETDITLYQLCYWKVTRIYGLTPEQIEELIKSKKTGDQTPSHHRVDPRIIKAYLTGEQVPTYIPGHWLPRFFGTLPDYLPRDRFLPSEEAVPLVDSFYCDDYSEWKRCWDENKRIADYLTEHLTDPLLTTEQGLISASLKIPPIQHTREVLEARVQTLLFVITVRAAEIRWWDGYFRTYHSFDDLILLRGHFRGQLKPGIRTVSWYAGKTAREIYATALTIFQVGLPNIQLHPDPPTNPDYNSLSPDEKYWIYNEIDCRLYRNNRRELFFVHKALSTGDTGPPLHSGLADQKVVIAFVCRFQVILSHGYLNFPTIDEVRQILLDKYKRSGLNDNPYLEDYQTVREGSSWEGGGPIHLPLIPQDSVIADNYRQYRDLARIETDSVRNPPKRPRLDEILP